MDIDARIRRRQRVQTDRRLIVDYDRLSPVAHVDDPVGRGPVVERLLDHLDPAFRGELPPNGCVYGPKGSGKSAVVSVLFDRLASLSLQPGAVIHTATRVQMTEVPSFVYIDARKSSTRFALYRDLLSGLSDDSVPDQGVGTDWMFERLERALARQSSGVVVAIDHLGEVESEDLEWLLDALSPLDKLSWLAIRRTPPGPSVPVEADAQFEMKRYQDQVLIDLLMTRANEGFPGESLNHAGARRIAEWADGDAHDALSALLGAAEAAISDGNNHVRETDIEAGIDSVPRPGVSLGRIFALPENKQSVLRSLIDLDESARDSVTTAASTIAAVESVSLSPSTVKRFLYQLAETGIIERVPHGTTSGKGRPPSRVEPRFATRAFRKLYDAR
ncbi:Cdc6/Cdc18 family protein [Halobellus captivus]|uniref:Cdc6/Cdc18 family protein n=1 Tax=Halobellus captivus TaxID=2592614 RepID=UPI0011A85366|nr:AAA family ATPase [Halobellus captivus]